jgi:flavin reductase
MRISHNYFEEHFMRQKFLDGMSRAATSVCVVTTDGPAGVNGMTVSAMTSVSADSLSPSLLICVNKASLTAAMVIRNGVFCVNLLREDQSVLSDIFSGRTRAPSTNKFDQIDYQRLSTGSPVINGVVVAFDCRIAQTVEYGTHWILIGNVQDIQLSPNQSPLIYANRCYSKTAPITQPHH